MSFDELTFVAWLRDRLGEAGASGIGDDMAVLDIGGATMLVSSDMLLDGRHFDTREHDYDAVGRKAVNCCLSDCAAMAVRPVAVTMSLAFAASTADVEARALIDGALEAACACDVRLAGGDTTRWNAPLAVDVAVVAEPWPNVSPIMRAGARVGDALYVTGKLGGSSLGRHLSFEPRVAEARILAAALGDDLHAMIDITDGLSLDLWRLCQASGVGGILKARWLDQVTSHDASTLSARDGTSSLEHVLCDGEDFELLLAVTDADAVRKRSDATGVPFYRVGTCAERGLALIDHQGTSRPLEPRGFIH